MRYDVRENDKLNSNEEENEDFLNEYRVLVSKICLELIILNYLVIVYDSEKLIGNEVYSIVLGEDKYFVLFMFDK